MATEAVKEFWDKQAEELGTQDIATAPDHFYRELEIECIAKQLKGNAIILDVGCGNGYSTKKFATQYTTSKFVGIDYSESMINQAEKHPVPNVSFAVWDIRDKCCGIGFDIAVSERCLINLESWDEQKKAILTIKESIKPGGRLILVENTVEGLASLNKVRKSFNLPVIEQRWHNKYISRHLLNDFLYKNNMTVQSEQNIGCLYYLISRVLYAKMADLEGKQPEYGHIINELAAKMPVLPRHQYSPNSMWVVKV